MGSFAIPSLSALGLWRRGSSGEPGAPERRLNTVARAAAPAMARSGQGTQGSHWWRAQFGSPARIREWAAQELTNGRLLPWFAVAYGRRRHSLLHGGARAGALGRRGAAAACTLGAALLRRQIVPHVIALGLFGIVAVATLKTALINHPVLRFAASGVTVAGFVELREESQHTDRFVLRVDRIDGGRIEEPPWRVRLSVKRGMAPPAGSFVEVKASLEPPLQPLEPGSYDFARDLFFQGIGASGFVRGAMKVITAPAPQGMLARAERSCNACATPSMPVFVQCSPATTAPSPRC